MKCKILEVQGLKPGSPWPMLECGGAYVNNGDKIVVNASVAQRYLIMHPIHLKMVGDCERDSLAGGHYAVESGDVEPETEKAKADPEPETDKEPVAKDETPAEKADDKSMRGRGNRRKKKTKS